MPICLGGTAQKFCSSVYLAVKEHLGIDDDYTLDQSLDELGNVTLTDLGSVYPDGINDAGQVVGSHKWGSRKKRHYSALLWENGTMTSLVDMLSNSEGIGDIIASGINEHGDIVGYLYEDGYRYAYIAVANSPTP